MITVPIPKRYRQTDGRADGQNCGITALCVASRGKNEHFKLCLPGHHGLLVTGAPAHLVNVENRPNTTELTVHRVRRVHH